MYLAARNERRQKGKKGEKIGKTRRAAGDAEGKDGKRVVGDEERTIDRLIVVVVVRSICSGEIS